MAYEPIFTENLKSAKYELGETAAPLVAAAEIPGGGSVNYRWQESPDGVAWSDIVRDRDKLLNYDIGDDEFYVEEEDTAEIYVNTEQPDGEFEFLVQGKAREGSLWFDIGAIPLDAAVGADPSIDKITKSGIYTVPISGLIVIRVLKWKYSSAHKMTIFIRVGGGLNPYTNGTYTPNIGSLGTRYYRIIAENWNTSPISSTVSDVAQISVVTAETPVFKAELPKSIKYDYGDIPKPLDGTAEVSDGGTLKYEWYKKGEGDADFVLIQGADGPIYRPTTVILGKVQYKVKVTNSLKVTSATAQNGPTEITVVDTTMTAAEKQADYRRLLRQPFSKLCRLRFLQPDGSTAFALDNNPTGRFAGAFIKDGSLSVNLSNGRRRTATVTLSNLDGDFDYNVNKIWFGNEVALDEGMILSDGSYFYIQQGVFLIENPQETVAPANRTAKYDLVDKWANLDGALFGNLESTYIVPRGTNIFEPITALLAEDRGNGLPIDGVPPIYTDFYNGKTQETPDGGTAKLTDTPYTLRIENESGTLADICLGLAEMLAAWIGYDAAGALRIDPSQDDILDSDKPLAWQFSQDEADLLGMDYTEKNTEVYNDFIVIGEALDDGPMVAARAQNLDPESDTNIALIGRKTVRYKAAGYTTKRQCEDLSVWKLKRSTALQKAVSIECSQILHLRENDLVSIVRSDKPGSPVERHLVQSFTRPLTGSGSMRISAVSVQDFPTATLTTWPLKADKT